MHKMKYYFTSILFLIPLFGSFVVLCEEETKKDAEKIKITVIDITKEEKIEETTQIPEKKPEEKPAENENAPEQPLSKFAVVNKLNEILSVFEAKSPTGLGAMNGETEEAIINETLKKLRRGIVFSREKSKEEAPVPEPEYYPPVIVSSQKVVYIRIDGFSEKILTMLKDDLQSVFRLKNKPKGVLIDLRNAVPHKYDYVVTLKTLALFIPGKLLPFIDGVEYPELLVKNMPIIALIGGKTCGEAEIFLNLMCKMKFCITLGEITAGSPFRMIEFPLKTGGYVRIPEIPKDLSEITPLPIPPSIVDDPVHTGKQIGYKDISSQIDTEKTDPALKNALEIILCVEGLHPEKEEKKVKSEKNNSGNRD